MFNLVAISVNLKTDFWSEIVQFGKKMKNLLFSKSLLPILHIVRQKMNRRTHLKFFLYTKLLVSKFCFRILFSGKFFIHTSSVRNRIHEILCHKKLSFYVLLADQINTLEKQHLNLKIKNAHTLFLFSFYTFQTNKQTKKKKSDIFVFKIYSISS